jgi:hypothetical protein
MGRPAVKRSQAKGSTALNSQIVCSFHEYLPLGYGPKPATYGAPLADKSCEGDPRNRSRPGIDGAEAGTREYS